MARRVEGKVVLVTGAASGIGYGAALVLAREGAKVVATDIQDEKGAGLMQRLEAMEAEAAYFHHDVTHEEDWRAMVEKVRARFGRLDVLVNNAGIGLSSPVVDMSFADWKRQVAVNLDSVFLGVKYFLPLMRAGEGWRPGQFAAPWRHRDRHLGHADRHVRRRFEFAPAWSDAGFLDRQGGSAWLQGDARRHRQWHPLARER